MTEFSFDVFLSHNSKDKPAVRELKQILTEAGLRVWLDEDELRPGIGWMHPLEKGIKSSQSVAVIICKDGLGPWEDEGVQAALRLAVKDGRAVIPVLLPSALTKPEWPLFLGNRTWVDLRDGFTKKGLDNLCWGITGKKPEHKRTASSLLISPTRLRHGADHLFGREKELEFLDNAWADPKTHIVTIVAWGGVGKTSLVVDWMAKKAADNWPGFERVFDWSFYSQGTREQGSASADTFIAAALKFFGDEAMANSAASPWDKGARLAKLISERKTLLVLDGMEPLQYPPNSPMAGQIKDPALATLLKGLAQQNDGLCVVTTRERVAELIPFQETTAPEFDLRHLPTAAGINLLKSLQVKGSEADFRELVEEVAGHALTLRILGCYLCKAHQGDIRKRDHIKFEKADKTIQGGHAFKTIAAYERWMKEAGTEGVRALAVLRLMGLFDRPADSGCIQALRNDPFIAGLTEPLVGLPEEDWNVTLSYLMDCHLLSVQSETNALDAHPLIREYFGNQLKKDSPAAWNEAHKRLYEHLKNSVEHKPDTLAGLQPLYQAVVHACLAGLHQEVCDDIFFNRILRGADGPDAFYSFRKLGAIGADLGAVACFFDHPWDKLATGLKESDQAWVLNQAAFRLRALGRLHEALEPMRATLQLYSNQKLWINSALVATNLSELELTLGLIPQAVKDGKQSVVYADRSGDDFQRMGNRTTPADALHQAGNIEEARKLFLEAEAMQVKRQPQAPLLYSLQGFRYCDLLLGEIEKSAWRIYIIQNPLIQQSGKQIFTIVNEHAEEALKVVLAGSRNLLDIALNHLTLGRSAQYLALLTDSKSEQTEARKTAHQQFGIAVEGLRRAGVLDYILRGLLSRAWLRYIEEDREGSKADLDEAWEITERGDMKLHMCDVHLYRARLFHAIKPYPWESWRKGLDEAKRLIDECGYHRRDQELADAEEAAKNWD